MAGLYRGIGPTIAAVAPFLAFQQSVYDVLKFTALANDVPAGLPLFLSCGAAAGAAAQSMVYPMDLIRRRMQVRAESTTLIGMGVIQDIMRLIVLWRYYTVFQDIRGGPLYNNLQCTINPVQSHPQYKYIQPPHTPCTHDTQHTSLTTNINHTSLATRWPIHAFRRTSQMGLEGEAAGHGPMRLAAQVARSAGIRGLFSGLTPTVLKTMPSVAITKAVGDYLLVKANP